MVNKASLTPQEIDKWFVRPAPSIPNTFQFSLVLGGTVSAGAYTAGVVDFLIEALDCWTTLRDRENGAVGGTAPRHNTILNVIAGTSGGGVNAGITARTLAYEFPHVVAATPNPATGTGNPLFDVWINKLTLAGLLDTSDIDAKKLISLLNGAPIDDAATVVAGFAGAKYQPRSWVGDPLRVILTLTNMRGVPYLTDFGDGLSETFVDHADYGRFAFVYPTRGLPDPRPDEFVLGFDGTRLPQAIDWDTFSQYGRATAAFPIGFPPRALVRPVDHYRYRVIAVPSDQPGQPDQVLARVPDWDALTPAGAADVPSDYHFLTVDGGTTDNEPIELARTSLSGMSGRNPRGAKEADRAVILVDPFAGMANVGPETVVGLPEQIGGLITTLTEQTRYDSQDLLLAANRDVFSRFMITAKRDGMTGGAAIASNGLGAFIGFACKDFTRHDYILGRANCQQFLRDQFVLDAANPVFDGAWTEAQKATHGVMVNGSLCLPLIPLLDTAAIPEQTLPWPKHALDPAIFHDAIENRFKSAVEFEGSGGLISSSAAFLLAHAGESFVADYAVKKLTEALQAAGLS